MSRHILITASLPYANGPLHLGHILEYTQADIWARFQRLKGHQAYYICGSDAHGTPIMLRAQKENLDPAVMVEQIREQHMADFRDFDIVFDNFYTTHSEENRELACDIFEKIKAAGHITEKTIEQAFDPEKNMFLPDRFVKGTCPKCGADDQYGDACEVCGATYDPTDLKNPLSVLTGATPIQKTSTHYFFELAPFANAIQTWMRDSHLQVPVIKKMNEWFESGLQAWDITRDAPYFGFTIPGTTGKYFYVWMDAPVGYMASFKHFCAQRPDIDFDSFWQQGSNTELYHFIGKDVMYFHTLFWPAMLLGSHYKRPNGVFVHGFVTVNGQKMSKSRGTFITARAYLKHLAPDYLRYYFAAKLNAHIEDIDLNLEDFSLRVNADLVNKLVNIASRTAGFIRKKFDNRLAATLDNEALIQQLQDQADHIAELYESRQYGEAMRVIMQLADEVNSYISDVEPWALAKDESQLARVHAICTTAINAFRILMIYLTPVLPTLSEKTVTFLNVVPFTWQETQVRLLDHAINDFKPMISRVDPETLSAILAEGQA